jgi:hypothetical protein
MKIMYETHNYGTPITPVEVERETENSIWIKGTKRAKKSNYSSFFDTIQQAKQYLLNKADKSIVTAENSVAYLKEEKRKLLLELEKINP